MRRSHLALCLVAALAACASETRYQPAEEPGDYGYREEQIESDRWRVSFRGNSMTDLESVERALLYRAAELTLQQGYDWFRIVDRDTEAERHLQTTGFRRPFTDGFRHSYFHRRRRRSSCAAARSPTRRARTRRARSSETCAAR
jgi:hypothetical protein